MLSKFVSGILRFYYLGHDHLGKLRLWGWFRRFFGYPRLIISYAGRGWISVDERDYVQGFIFRDGLYEPEVWKTLADFAASNEVVWDIGAYIGTFTIPAMLDTRVSKIYAFEPDPINADILTKNLALNKGQCTICRFALSSQRETKKLYHGPLANTGKSSLTQQVSNEIFDIDCRTADGLVFQEGFSPPTLMKIDVEGWEFEVFKGSKRLLTELPPKAIVFESITDKFGKLIDAPLANYLDDLGYDVRWIKRPSGAFEERENFLAVPRHSN